MVHKQQNLNSVWDLEHKSNSKNVAPLLQQFLQLTAKRSAEYLPEKTNNVITWVKIIA